MNDIFDIFWNDKNKYKFSYPQVISEFLNYFNKINITFYAKNGFPFIVYLKPEDKNLFFDFYSTIKNDSHIILLQNENLVIFLDPSSNRIFQIEFEDITSNELFIKIEIKKNQFQSSHSDFVNHVRNFEFESVTYFRNQILKTDIDLSRFLSSNYESLEKETLLSFIITDIYNADYDLNFLNLVGKNKENFLKYIPDLTSKEKKQIFTILFYNIEELYRTNYGYQSIYLEIFINPLHICKNVMQNKYHSNDVYNHLLSTLISSKSIFIENNNSHYSQDDDLKNIFNEKNNKVSRLFLLAALFHDIGKPQTRKVSVLNKVSFHKHEVVGAKITRSFMKEYGFKPEEIEYTTKLVRHHQWYFPKNAKNDSIRKLLTKLDKDWIHIVYLRLADRRGNDRKKNYSLITKEIKEFYNKAKQIINNQIVFYSDLDITKNEIKSYGFKDNEIENLQEEMLGMVINHPYKNTNEDLQMFLQKKRKKCLMKRQ